MSNQPSNTTPPVDLVIVIDTSPSMKDEAQALSKAAQVGIKAAASSCPSDLRVTWLGVEGTWKNTNFNRTIRDYLTTECKVVDSQIRGRKRGELKSAGAQEDGARAIEDISNHFNWRTGAARAIFYLGDEALEGGGQEVQQQDIQAANLAIQTAQKSQVTIHTYFGTSKSKHKEKMQQEFARLAQQTGGKTFTHQDIINGFEAVLEQVICGSRSTVTDNGDKSEEKPTEIIDISVPGWLSWDNFPRNPQTDIVCISPVRTIVRREEEIVIVRKVRKVEEVDASPACPVNSTQV